MNILPKKSWHVRNKDNVARVRRDEAKALEEEQEVAKRKALAEQEARIRILREKVRAEKHVEKEPGWDLPQEPVSSDDEEEKEVVDEEYKPLNTAYPADKHINLFEDFEQKKKSHGANKDYEDEKRKAQEAYEKKIGYLKYLGQSASEALTKKPWYEQIPNRGDAKTPATTTFSEHEVMRTADPLLSMKGYLDKKKQVEDVYYGRTKEVSLDIDHKVKHRRVDCSRSHESADNLNIPSDAAKLSSHDSRSHRKHKHEKESKKKKSKKHKRFRTSCSDEPPEPKKPSIEDLRAARYEREAAERHRSIEMISRLQGYSTPARSVIDERSLTYNTVYMPRAKR